MRVRLEHWTLLLDICEKNSELITNKFNGPEGKAKGHALWQHVAHRLNSLGFDEKSKEDWRRALIDWKSKTKAKASKIKQELEKTGGGPPNYMPLSELENRLLSLMGRSAVDGDNVQEMGFGQVTIAKQGTNHCDVPFETPPLPGSSSQSNKENVPTTESCEHDDIGKISNKKSEKPYSRSNNRRVQNSRERFSNRLTTVSEESVKILKDIHLDIHNLRDDIKSIADSLQVIAAIMQQSAHHN